MSYAKKKKKKEKGKRKRKAKKKKRHKQKQKLKLKYSVACSLRATPLLRLEELRGQSQVLQESHRRAVALARRALDFVI